jgi:SAM-dependent methyltransferase
MPLAYYSRAASKEFWNDHWGDHDSEALIEVARQSALTRLIEQALPRHGLVLEAGCGLGAYVVLLRERGYSVVGADWSFEALRRCRRASRTAPLTVMDLGVLGITDASVAAYLSLGVVEHDPDGPGRILRDAHRVLAPEGRLILSVPYMNGARRLSRPYLVRLQASVRAQGGEFYQYAFTAAELREMLRAHGFHVLSLTPYDPGRVLRKVLGRATALLRRGSGRSHAHNSAGPARRSSSRIVIRRLVNTGPLLRLLGHMVLAVAIRR